VKLSLETRFKNYAAAHCTGNRLARFQTHELTEISGPFSADLELDFLYHKLKFGPQAY